MDFNSLTQPPTMVTNTIVGPVDTKLYFLSQEVAEAGRKGVWKKAQKLG